MYLQEYAQGWLDKYPILEVRAWNSHERKINTGVQGKKFYIDVRDYYFYRNSILSSTKAFIILHELMHAALVREDELFLPNLGMSTDDDSFDDVVGIPYWLNELSMYVYMQNIIKAYPANPLGGELTLSMPGHSYSFFEKAANYSKDVPEEWRGVSSEKAMMWKFSDTFTVSRFEEKLTKTLDFLTAVLNQIPDKSLRKKTTTVKPPWPQYVREPLYGMNYHQPIRISPARQAVKQRPR